MCLLLLVLRLVEWNRKKREERGERGKRKEEKERGRGRKENVFCERERPRDRGGRGCGSID